MALRRILYILAVAFAAYVGLGSTPYGGCWLVPKKIGFSSAMGVCNQSPSASAIVAAVLLSANYHTVIDSVDSTDGLQDTIYTMGLGDYYSKDSSGSDTTALYLHGYVGQDIDVMFFFMGLLEEALFVEVEQALRYDTTMGDSGFDYGFITTDTLFVESLEGSLDMFIVEATSHQGAPHRQYSDSFTLHYPCMRFKIYNLSEVKRSGKIHIEMYARHVDEVMSGVSGRLNQELYKKMKYPRGR